MVTIHPGATLTPHFRDFLPPWVAAHEWYAGAAGANLRPVGFLRLDDPAGEVGLETHLLTDGRVVHQVPLSYRDAPLPGADAALVATAEHSVLGRRWIYDAVHDPVWVTELLRVVREEDVTIESLKKGAPPASARGRWHPPAPAVEEARLSVHVVRNLMADAHVDLDGAVGSLWGSWHPDGPGGPSVSGLLATLFAG